MIKYARLQMLFHWLTVMLLVIAYATIELKWLADRGTWQRNVVMITHFSAGVCVLLMMFTRVFLRTRHRTPPVVPPLKHWQTGLSHLVHTLLYALFIVLPVLGVSSRYLRGRDWSLFGLNMPVSAVSNPELASTLIDWHETLAPLGYWLIGLHAVAALFHHYVMKDNTLRRMMP
ncbi:cytochrome b561 [Erwinia psidii]|uniref:Cytochrome b561 n=1 Tax=Erwinia psidii TaxID=69224 RepID=A0A3N6SKA9_9GAMM|nr:cytochrome b561 [Erwinia psidii]MCX8956241.1 cytochrome b561 [Erwinia psidii]MCX8959999.1 cytochrome b561 [Erwinia psidii]MCX8963544.1 cytochrome b561 [Erwinia psidii]RQM39241.1 cytochrome b561 [Erwinia psidii]